MNITYENNLKLLYEQKKYPIFQNVTYQTEGEAKNCLTGNIILVENQSTGLIYNESFNQELVNYDNSYQNEQSISAVFKNHLENVSVIIEKYLGKNSIIEIGCGKGYFIELLLNKGFKIIGFDPTYEGCNENIIKSYFTPNVKIHSKGVILRHVLEHIQDPYTFLENIKEANNGTGTIYIEVPCFEWICDHRAWFDIYYEHVNYFRKSDFYRLFSRIYKSGKLFNGQYIYTIADLNSLRKPTINNNDKIHFPDHFTDTVYSKKNMEKYESVIWGASSKGVIYSLLKKRNNQLFLMAIDINNKKQEKFLPASGLIVKSPADAFKILPNETIIHVMNSNYLNEIKELSNNIYKYITID